MTLPPVDPIRCMETFRPGAIRSEGVHKMAGHYVLRIYPEMDSLSVDSQKTTIAILPQWVSR